jgi:hypothetical protein
VLNDPGPGWRRLSAALLAAIVAGASISHAQDVTETSLRAAFIYNIAKFTEWPVDVLSAATPFAACVLGDTQVGDALERSVKGRQLAGRAVTVVRVPVGGPLRSCHLLYISGLRSAQVTAILATVGGAPVLTIGDVDDFARIGGIAHVFVENGTMRFDIDLGLARRSRLQLSSRLLVLAVHVHDGPGPAQP